MSKDSVSFGMGLLFGVVAGVAAGVLLSPKSGEEMRQDLKNVIDNISDEEEINNCKNASIEMINRMKYTIERQLLKVNDAIKAGRMAAAKRKEEMESGYSYN